MWPVAEIKTLIVMNMSSLFCYVYVYVYTANIFAFFPVLSPYHTT